MDEKKGPINILIVEDEHDIRQLYSEVLTDAGYIVDQASDGEEGMNKIKTTDWHLLLLDIMLPGRDGLRILADLKADPSIKKGPVVALTNLNTENIIQEAFNAGADGYLIKSDVTPDKIVEEVGKFFNKEETQQ